MKAQKKNLLKTEYNKLFYEFLDIYKRELSQKHFDWIYENPETTVRKIELMQKSLFYLENSKQAFSFPIKYQSKMDLDMRYLYFYKNTKEEIFLETFNPVIHNFFVQHYFVSTLFEKFIDKKLYK